VTESGLVQRKSFLEHQRLFSSVPVSRGQVEAKTVATQNRTKPKLVVFDVEGVLIPKNRLFFEVGRSLGLKPLLKVLFFGFLYEMGAMRLKSVLKRLFMVTRGAKPQLFMQSLEKLPLMPNVKEVFASLKSAGCKTALISSGLPTVLVKKLADMFGADYAVGVEVGIKDEVVTGEIWGEVIEPNGKLLVFNQILKTEGLRVDECVVVADDRNNACLFLKGIQKIGYTPDFLIRTKAGTVVNGKLSKILPVINGEKKSKALPSRNDVFREMIHGSGFFVPVVAGVISVPVAALLICIVIAFYAASELSRVKGKNMPLISTITRHAASQTELCEFTFAPIYFAVGIVLTLLLFPVPASSAAIAIFALGDSTASLVGGLITKKPLPLNRGKTLEGSLAGFAFAFLAGSFFVAPWMALVGAAVAMTVEFLPLPVNDNVLIPLCAGLTLMLVI
jgi:phosphoserine phosphatase